MQLCQNWVFQKILKNEMFSMQNKFIILFPIIDLMSWHNTPCLLFRSQLCLILIIIITNCIFIIWWIMQHGSQHHKGLKNIMEIILSQNQHYLMSFSIICTLFFGFWWPREVVPGRHVPWSTYVYFLTYT